MALVTIQRSPSVVNSPHCSLSDIEKEESEDENGDSECFFAGKGTALILPTKELPSSTMERRLSTESIKSTNSVQSNSSDIQQHLQQMFVLLRRDETLKMAVRLESQRPNRTRYLAIVSRSYFQNSNHRSFKKLRNNNKESDTKLDKQNKSINLTMGVLEKGTVSDIETKDTGATTVSVGVAATTTQHKKKPSCDFKDIEESCLLGIDCNEKTTVGLVLPILADTTIHLDGDGGFSISVFGNTHIFKPVSVQAMWSALQSLHKVSKKARENNFYPGGPSHHWIQYYQSVIDSDRSCLNEWNAMDSLESIRPPSPDAIRNKPTQKEEAEKIIKMKLREIMMSVDLDEVTSKYIRSRLEEHLNMDLNEYKSFIDKEMLVILGQMDSPTEIFEHVYLGSEWNASNLEELQKNGVSYILNVTREIDNFFPGTFKYLNIRVYDDEKTNLLKHWDNTYKFISEAKKNNSKILVHCKMGVSRSASVVVAYAMKAFNWDFDHALDFVKGKRNCIKPNKNFLTQLETYRGMLDAMKNKEKLQRSKSETNLKAAVKDARLLPGSEPTPLIQALNRSSKNTLCVVDDSNLNSNNSSRSSSKESHRKIVRRSNSSSPKIVQNPIVALKQQSQSLDNLTPQPESVNIEEFQKNVRHTDVNGQNYSITQNQILHIQKSTASTNSGIEIASTSTLSSSSTSISSTSAPAQFASLSVTTIGMTTTAKKSTVKSLVNDLESSNQSDNRRKTKEDRKSLNLLNLQPIQNHPDSDQIKLQEEIALPISTTSASPTSTFKGPVWTSSSKVIHQPSKLYSSTFQKSTSDDSNTTDFTRIDNKLCDQYISSSCSKSSSFIHNQNNTSNIDNNNFLEQQNKQQNAFNVNNRLSSCSVDSATDTSSSHISQRNKIESRSSRYSSSSSFETTSRILPSRNGSWGSYDTNRKNFRFSNPAIVEGQVFDRDITGDRSTASTFSIDRTFPGKRTKIRSDSFISRDVSHFISVGGKEKYLSECEIADYSLKNSTNQQLSVSAPEYPISLKKSVDRKLNRSTSTIGAEKIRLPNNVQSLKKNFEAKINTKETASLGSGVACIINKGSTSPSPTDSPVTSITGTSNIATTNASINASTENSKLLKYSKDNQQNDLSVKCLVNKYQFHNTGSRINQQHHHYSSSSSTSTSTSSLSSASTLYRGRPHSCYESRTNKPPDIVNIGNTIGSSSNSNNSNNSNKQIINNNDCRPPPGPTLFKTSSTNNQITMTLSCRKLQQHGRTHPLTRLSKPKVCNSPTYHTM